MGEASKSRWVRLISLLALIIFGCLLAFVVVEITIRITKGDIAFQPDPDLIRSLRPNVVRKIYGFDTPEVLKSLPAQLPSTESYLGMDYTNNIGLRMKDDVGSKKPGEKRILFLGDSYPEADGVDNSQRFYYLVQQYLNTSPASNWRIINAGIQNGSPVQYILQLRRYLETIKPDVVVLFFAPNDFQDDFFFENRFGFVFDNNGIPLHPQSQFKLWLLQNSWALRYLDVLAQRKSPWLDKIMWPPFLPNQNIPNLFQYLCTQDDPYAYNWFHRKTGKYILELKRMSEEAHVSFNVVLINYFYTFDNEPFYQAESRQPDFYKWEAQCHSDKGAGYRKFMYGFLSENNIQYYDLYNGLLQAKVKNPKEKLWFYYDYHFSPAGHAVVAKELIDFFSKSKIIPELARTGSKLTGSQ